MKIRTSIIILAGLAGTLLLAACKKEETKLPSLLTVDYANGYSAIDLSICEANLNQLPHEPLSDDEKAGIVFMREEEKVCRDVSLYFAEKWGHEVFSKIAQSEATHMGAILLLIERYHLDDPVVSLEIAVFHNKNLCGWYETFTWQGENSLADALRSAAELEEITIIDLEAQLEVAAGKRDLTMIYENLAAASRNHLRSFVKSLAGEGVSYSPRHLDLADYNAIINNAWETGF